MANRAMLVLLSTFWVIMNVLLWRAEYSGRPGLGSSVPVHVVWEKILTAPDSSSLTVFRRGKKIGFCHWTTSVSEDLSRMSSSDAPPEGMVRKIVNYRLEFDGNVMLAEPSDRLRFDTHLDLGSGQQWQDFDLRLNLRPAVWQVRSHAATQSVLLAWDEDKDHFERSFSFSELQHPEAIVRELGGPLAAAWLSGLGVASPSQNQALSLGLKWEARNESVRLGHSSVRVYRLETRLLDRFSLVVFVSRVGEILRVELPDGIVLANDQLGGN